MSRPGPEGIIRKLRTGWDKDGRSTALQLPNSEEEEEEATGNKRKSKTQKGRPSKTFKKTDIKKTPTRRNSRG